MEQAGGGYYGGGGSIWHSGGGGGSSFISGHDGCIAIDEQGTPTEDSIHYSGITFTDTVMIDGNGYEWTTQKGSYIKMEDPYGNYVDGKTGNGYARITLLEDPSQNNLIKEIQINKGTITPEVNYDDTEYTVELGTEDTELTIYGVVDDITAKIEGNGTYDILPGENKIELTVTAENGDVRVYTITVKREASSNAKPINITIDGLIESIININPEKYGKLVPETFDADVYEYSMVVPSRIKKLTFNVEKGHEYQTVTGDGQVVLDPGENKIEIAVTSEDGSKTNTYVYNIERDMSGNCMLESLSVTNVENDIEFDQDILEYYMIVPNTIDHLDIEAIPEVKTLTPNIIGNTNLKVGLNDIYIIINAENGEQLVYIIHAYRMMSGNTFLSSLEVYSGENKLTMTPEYNKILDTYEIKVPNEIQNINIVATPEVTTTSIEGAGEKTLNTGINIFTITTTAQDGSQDTYTINIEREKSSNNFLKALSVAEGEFTENFDKETLEYHVEVESNVNNLNIIYEREVETSKVQIIDNRNFKAGENVVQIKVIAENGEQRIYKIIVNRKKSENNYLLSLSTNYGTLQPEFNKEVTDYTVEVDNEIETINVSATREDLLSTISGTGKYALKIGENSITISVTSENGDVRNYNLNVIRKLNSNKNLAKIENSKNARVVKIDESTYSINVENDVKQIEIKGIPEVATSTVTGNGKKELSVGENIIILTVTAEDNTTKDYTIIINRAKSNNANLKSLFIKESDYTPTLTAENTLYYTKVLTGTTNLTMNIETEDDGATYEIIGNENFVSGENEVTIRVTASDGITKKDYKIRAFVQQQNTGSNYLYIITVNKGTLTPNFTKEEQVYEVTVPYETSNIEVSAITEDSMATLTGTGTYDLKVGLNVIAVKVTSTDGIERTYQIKITREKSTETRLSSLEVKEHTITPEFDMDTKTYNVTTTLSSLDIIAQTYDSDATYEIIGNENLQKGVNNVIIKVTAPNGVDTENYTLVVTRTESYNNNLEYLKVEGYNITPEFNKAISVYQLDVSADVNKVNVLAKAEQETSTVSGTGIITLNSGKNVIPVTVTSEAGTTKTYTIIINKEKSDNNYLENLLVSEGTLTPVFNKETEEYSLEVEYDVDNIYVLAYAEDATATISGNGQRKLLVGQNKIEVVVTSESGLTRTYTINVLRKPAVSALLKKLEVKDYSIQPKFDMNTKSYSVTVNNEITSLDLIIETLDDNATYTITGNSDFIVGNNKVIIHVLSSDGVTTEDYVINVNRQIYSNNFLSYILPSKGTLSPSFEKETMNYKITVEDTVDSIYIDAEAEDSNSTVEGVGTYSLNKGENVVNLKVTSALGITRIYTITIIRSKNNNTNLSKLEVKNGSNIVSITPIFNKDTLEYNADVEEGTSRLQIIAEPQESTSTVTGTGYVTVSAGENTYNIIVKAEDGSTKTYVLKVNRPKSSNNYLTDLIPSVGTLSPNFSYDETNYTVTVGNADALLSFEVNTENRYATVSGIEEQIIPDGESTRNVVVTAEDGTTRTYTITVIKNRTDDARLKSLQVSGYTLEETFNEDKFTYTLNVSNEITKLYASDVIAVAKYDTSTVYLDEDLDLSTKTTNTFNVKVLAKDGFTTQIYKINVIRAKNDNNNLSNLEAKLDGQILNLTPQFDKDTLQYFVSLPEGTENIEIIANVENEEATVSGIGIKNIQVGENSFEIVVTAENGNKKTYKLIATRPANTNTFLSSLVPSIGSLTPEFNKNILEYTVEVENEDYYISFEATPESKISTVTGTEETYIEDGENIREIVVTAEDGNTKKYTVKVVKNRTNDPRLKSLAIKSFTFDQEFSPDLYEYTLTVPNDKFEITENEIVAKAKYEESTITYTGKIELSVLEVNKYEIIVTSPDGTKTATYTINIIRKKSSDSSLASLSVTGYKIKEKFESSLLEYTVLVQRETETLEVSRIKPVPTDEYASIVMSKKDLDLSNGEKIYKIEVTSHDETTKTTYTLNVEFAKSDNAYLKTLQVQGGTISPAFDKNITTYNIKVPSRQNDITISAETEDAYASIVEGIGTITITEDTQILLKVQAEDESYRIYILNVTKEPKTDTTISGKIITENAQGKHIASIDVYKTDGTLVTTVDTNEDGTYEIYVVPDTYNITIRKKGYLNLNINNIVIENLDQEVTLDSYKLVAGDVVETGEIEIDDLVDLNDNFGVIIDDSNKQVKSIYDLNEDGIIDRQDRNILKKNYGKKSENIEWVNPNVVTTAMNLVEQELIESEQNSFTQDFILPIKSEYVITSEYGKRVHPITGETSFHSGIDIVGTHHTEILAVVDGEVTYSGVQSGYGNCVEIKHVVNGEIIYSFYAHLSKINVKVGQKVIQGEIIGLEGGASTDPNPGTSTGHHLHFELRKDTGSGNSLDPNDYIEF